VNELCGRRRDGEGRLGKIERRVARRQNEKRGDIEKVREWVRENKKGERGKACSTWTSRMVDGG